METENKIIIKAIIGIIVFVIAIIIIFSAVMPKYRIYRQDMQGQANLRQQEWEKKILIEDANAKNESATLQAQALIKQETAKAEAEIIRAKGVAEANTIIAGSLKGNESYLRYLWIDKLSDNQNVIYVPTEAGLPLLEARNKFH
jgi:predicted Holliday junction resolvase-like endonuclease